MMEMKKLFITLVGLFAAMTLHAQSYRVECEDTCNHIHGLDMSHYQGDVWWETLGENNHMAYVYFKATEGSCTIS